MPVVTIAIAFEQEDASDMAVVGERVSENGDQDVLVIVAVDVDHGGMSRSGHVDLERVFDPLATGILSVGQQAVGEGIAGEDFGLGIVVEIDHLDVADPGRDLDGGSEGLALKWESGCRVDRTAIEGCCK